MLHISLRFNPERAGMSPVQADRMIGLLQQALAKEFPDEGGFDVGLSIRTVPTIEHTGDMSVTVRVTEVFYGTLAQMAWR